MLTAVKCSHVLKFHDEQIVASSFGKKYNLIKAIIIGQIKIAIVAIKIVKHQIVIVFHLKTRIIR